MAPRSSRPAQASRETAFRDARPIFVAHCACRVAELLPHAGTDEQLRSCATPPSAPCRYAAWLRANGVGEPEKWAQLVYENRPYPDGPEGAQKIRDVLTQHGASPQDVAAITNTVMP